jgi:hypothetical protein
MHGALLKCPLYAFVKFYVGTWKNLRFYSKDMKVFSNIFILHFIRTGKGKAVPLHVIEAHGGEKV